MSAMGALVAGVAHEVRNPLFAITATVDALEARAGLEGPYAPYLTILREQAGRLAGLMFDLLDYGRPHELRIGPVPPRQPMDDAIEQCSAMARERGVGIVSRPNAQLPVAIDLDRVARALRNLIENAVQFSPAEGSVAVESREERGPRGEWLIYEVCDCGPGFREEDLAQVLEPFFSRRRGGTGLGLAIARQIAEEHGGCVRVSNRPDGGGRVRLEIPSSLSAQIVA
ncbi:MAG: HAMP domain-containing histidine kinase [Candidatus Eisenbacteria bacterium]|uniref:histidine kinase n=1 Tax=Eiseniibacteriota bacterium TaxID=2212470 RepID=A0A538U7J0_UNCEI|nr:MAG: HAMP domain-containing histidine kinase [Candidatus Eisenbacteria bacterium]